VVFIDRCVDCLLFVQHIQEISVRFESYYKKTRQILAISPSNLIYLNKQFRTLDDDETVIRNIEKIEEARLRQQAAFEAAKQKYLEEQKLVRFLF
jgi:hypothetical protein